MGVVSTNISKGAIKLADSVVNVVVLAIIVILIAFGSYALWDSNKIHAQADNAAYLAFKPLVEDEGASFEELRAINPDVFSWLTVYGTKIDHPVVQGTDNMKYVNTSVRGDFSLSGSIFLDYQNKPDFSDFNSVFYGHHMEQNAMFGDLGLFSDEEFFNERLYGNLYFDGADHGLEFFAFLHSNSYGSPFLTAAIEGEDLQQKYLNDLLAASMYTRDIGVTIQDRIVLLSTCSRASTNGRDILIGRIVDTLYSDTFNTEKPNKARGFPYVDNPADALLWLLIISAALIGITALLIVLYNKKRKSKQRYATVVITADDHAIDDHTIGVHATGTGSSEPSGSKSAKEQEE